MSEWTESLTGVWNGRYEGIDGMASVSFVATLLHQGEMLSGLIQETPPDGPAAGRRLVATFQGSCVGQLVQFRKTYETAPPDYAWPVEYVGELDAARTTVDGVWQIQRNWGARFTMFRSFGEPAVKAVRAVERA